VNLRQKYYQAATYEKALQIASKQVALVYDDRARRGWLAPKLSLMLHLCHIYFRCFTTSSSQQTNPIPFAQPSSDESTAARIALSGQGDVIVFAYGGIEDAICLRNVFWMSVSISLARRPSARDQEHRVFLVRSSWISRPNRGQVAYQPNKWGFNLFQTVPVFECTKLLG
jgi:hypothetical protein